MSELYAMCDSVTIMKNGETLGTYPMQEKTESELLSLMVGSKVETGRQHKNRQAKSEKDILIKAPQHKNSFLWNRGKSGDQKGRDYRCCRTAGTWSDRSCQFAVW